MTTGLSIYGRTLRAYDGVGTLIFADHHPVTVNFEAGQLANGQILLWCHTAADNATQMMEHSDRVTGFEGTTQEGFTIRAEAQMREFGYLPPTPEMYDSCVMATYEFRDIYMDTVAKASKQVATLHFGLTNLLFTGQTAVRRQMGNTICEESVLPIRIGETEIALKRRPDYGEIAERLRSLRAAEVSAEAVVSASCGLENATKTVEDLCWLLSVARGTKVNWVYMDMFDSDGNLLQTRHANRITKRYSPLSVIDPGDRDDTARFVEQTYSRFTQVEDQYELCRGTIDAYLDAKAEADFLEMCAGKLAVCLERLKYYFAKAKDAEFILDERLFAGRRDELELLVRKWLKAAFGNNINRDQINAMAAKLKGLNRRSFASIMRRMSKSIDLDVSKEDLQTFVRARNALVHRGCFACTLAPVDDQSNAQVFSTPVDEWLFMVNVLDRVFLRMLDYNGPYLNRGKRPAAKEALQ